MKHKFLKIIAILIFGTGFSQIPISIENAYKKALENNLDIKSGQLRTDYFGKIQKSATVIDPLNISTEFGQVNSAYFDNRVQINQTLRLPNFYKSQNKILQEEWKNASLSLDLQKWQLKKELQLIYNQLNYTDEKEKLLKKADSIYSNYYQRAELRLKKGESNILEKTTAENYRSQAKIQLSNIATDREIFLNHFNILINDQQKYINEKSNFYNFSFVEDLYNNQTNHVLLKQLEQQKNIENAKLLAEKAKLLPSFTVGIATGTQRGVGPDEQYYDGSKRFQSGLVGVSLPLFNTAQKSIIEGQKINQLIAENNHQLGILNLKNQYSKSYSEYVKLKKEQEYYKTDGLKNAETILKTANRLYYEGEINYLEWSILVNQSLEIQNKYIDNQKLLNDRIIELNNLKN